MTRFIVAVSIVLPLTLGCKDDVQCEKTRMDLNKTWAELRLAATRHKLDGVDVPDWTDVETKAELLESSFLTSEVTWESAAKARAAISAKLPALQADPPAQLVGFRTSAESALKEQSSFEAECR